MYYNNKERTYIINIEAQKSTRASKLGYELINRMIYYICRMVSSQKGTEFIHSDYDNLKNVYSIWICMDTNVAASNTITSYEVQPRNIYGEYEFNGGYDLQRAVKDPVYLKQLLQEFGF